MKKTRIRKKLGWLGSPDRPKFIIYFCTSKKSKPRVVISFLQQTVCSHLVLSLAQWREFTKSLERVRQYPPHSSYVASFCLDLKNREPIGLEARWDAQKEQITRITHQTNYAGIISLDSGNTSLEIKRPYFLKIANCCLRGDRRLKRFSEN